MSETVNIFGKSYAMYEPEVDITNKLRRMKMERTVLKYQILETSMGFMALDVPRDEYLHDEKGNNCFDTIEEAKELVINKLQGESK